jgi:hypothetical protein
MEVSIKDGKGTQQEAKVDALGRVHTFAVIEPEDKYANRTGGTWSCYFTTTPVGAGDYFFYLKNGSEKELVITDIRVMSGSADTINVNAVSGTPTYTASADVSAINRNRGFSATTPTATIKKDTDITGLTDDGTLFFIRCDTANKLEHLRTTSNIIIPNGTAIALCAVTGTALITCIVSLSYLDEDGI